MKRELKEEYVRDLEAELGKYEVVWLTDFRGIDVESMNKLRKALFLNGMRYLVVKNSILRFAFDGIGLGALDEFIEGPTGICLGKDPVLGSKVLTKFQESAKEFKFKGCWFDSKVYSTSEIKEMAVVPGQDVLLSKLSGILISPLFNFVFLCKGILRKGVLVLDEISKMKEGRR